MKLFRQELMCIIGLNEICKLHPVKTPSLYHMNPSSPLHHMCHFCQVMWEGSLLDGEKGQFL